MKKQLVIHGKLFFCLGGEHMHWVKEQLKTISLFSQLSDVSDEELDAIVHIATVRTCKPKTIVFMQGDPLDRVFFMINVEALQQKR